MGNLSCIARVNDKPITGQFYLDENHNSLNNNCPFTSGTLSIQSKSSSLSSIVLQNTQDESLNYTDTLHCQAINTYPGCTSNTCRGSLMNGLKVNHSTHSVSSSFASVNESFVFLDEFYASSSDKSELLERKAVIKSSIETTGTYELTYEELAFGAKLAWRNASRCIGRIQWSKLEVFDQRHVRSTAEMFFAICQHLEYATNGGQIRSAITVFPPAVDGHPQCRIWNSQYVHYAGYRQEDGSIVGDPVNVEFTDYCMKLGWKGAGTEFDILPMLLQWGDNDPEYYEFPLDLVLEVFLQHSEYFAFTNLGLKWYGVPAVCNMSFDCGGIVFPACGFNGWYMTTEVMRDLCDIGRYNKLKMIAQSMGMDTSKPPVYWKDITAVKLNAAILDSFQLTGVTIVDHHTASESFMTHMSSEKKLRGGCPADWVWITPPISGSLTPVFHQEMLNYKLKPAFDYQPQPWRHHIWKCEMHHRRKFSLRSIAKALKLCSSFMSDALARRVSCSILYASETGQAEKFAKNLHHLFSQAFNAQVFCMDEYDFSAINSETLLLIVTSTFGNGEAPENGRMFCEQFKLHHLSSNKFSDDTPSLFKSLEQRYAVFALGSSAYPNFCQFGKTIDSQMATADWERLLPIGFGDAVRSQESSFNSWSRQCFLSACDQYGVQVEERMRLKSLSQILVHHSAKHRVSKSADQQIDITSGLSAIHKKVVSEMTVHSVTMLEKNVASKESVLVRLIHNGLCYQPGDHISMFPCNTKDSVQIILDHLAMPDELNYDDPINLECMSSLAKAEWRKVDRIPACSIRQALTLYLDITSPPKQGFLQQLISCDCVTSASDSKQLETISKDDSLYELWFKNQAPSLCNLLEEFTSIELKVSLLITQLPLLQPRFYSLSCSPLSYPNEIHITATVLKYMVGSESRERTVEGLCSNWLKNLQPGATVRGYLRECKDFHMPDDSNESIVMIGAGSGIAPFRGFWQNRMYQISSNDGKSSNGELHLLFGCRTQANVLHGEEIARAQKDGTLQSVTMAYSRVCLNEKVYVQDIVERDSEMYFDLLVKRKAHVYVCGDSNMANGVWKRLLHIIDSRTQSPGLFEMTGKQYLEQMKVEGRYHEDIFGANTVSQRYLGDTTAV